jgi:hypothetical protein
MTGRFPLLLALAVVVHGLFLASLVDPAHFLNPLFPEGVHNIGEGQGSDFFAFYQAGRYVLEGRDIYLRPMEDPDRVVPYAYFYRYFPFVACTLGVALNALPPWPAYWLWVALVEACLVACAAATWRMTRDRALRASLTAMWLMYTPFYMEQYMGQLTFVMAALAFAMALGHERGRARAFDWLWTASVLLKHLTLLFVPVFVRLRRFRAPAVAVALLAATTVPYYALRSSGVGAFAHDNFDLSLYPYPGNMGVLALVMVLKARLFPQASEALAYLGPVKVTLTRALVLATMAVPTLVALWVTFRRKPFDVLESLGLWTMVYFFVFREVWEYHYVLLLPFLVLYLARTRSRTLWFIYALAAMPTAFALYDVPGDNPEASWGAFAHILNHAFKVVPLVWLFVWTALGRSRGADGRPWLEGAASGGTEGPRAPGTAGAAEAGAS